MDEKFDREWALDQLAAAQVNLPLGNAVVKLIDAWNETPEEFQSEEALKLFNALARSQAIAASASDENWEPVEVAFTLSKGQVVRISPTAFKGQLGKIHNGRLVRVIDKRWGEVVVNSVDGREPELRGTRYPPNVLQVKRD